MNKPSHNKLNTKKNNYSNHVSSDNHQDYCLERKKKLIEI
jgi:hypothetical protein